jgi:predicted phosphoadenosine phosphosulfate sulfurtransferase
MARIRKYLDMDVLTAARKRMGDLYTIHDSVVISFSGGKDSLVCLALAREAAAKAGKLPVHVMFFDEELIPDPVLQTVDHYRQQDWVDLKWMCFPLESNKYVLGRAQHYIQWDPKRQHLRPKPAFAYEPLPGELKGEYSSQYEISAIVADRWFPGRVCFVTGVRASESLLRLRACLTSRQHAWLMGSDASKRLTTARPIYDWSENDVLKYIMEEKLVYSELYDLQHLAGSQLRVSTPLHSEAARYFEKWRAIAPTFYQQVVDLFPEMMAHERYCKEVDLSSLMKRYGNTGWTGVEQYIDEFYQDPTQRIVAYRRLAEIKGMAQLRPHAFPFSAILDYFIGGAIKRRFAPKMQEADAR